MAGWQSGDSIGRLETVDGEERIYLTMVAEVGDNYIVDAEGNRLEVGYLGSAVVEMPPLLERLIHDSGQGYAVSDDDDEPVTREQLEAAPKIQDL